MKNAKTRRPVHARGTLRKTRMPWQLLWLAASRRYCVFRRRVAEGARLPQAGPCGRALPGASVSSVPGAGSPRGLASHRKGHAGESYRVQACPRARRQVAERARLPQEGPCGRALPGASVSSVPDAGSPRGLASHRQGHAGALPGASVSSVPSPKTLPGLPGLPGENSLHPSNTAPRPATNQTALPGP